jgi:hypothetical protein
MRPALKVSDRLLCLNLFPDDIHDVVGTFSRLTSMYSQCSSHHAVCPGACTTSCAREQFPLARLCAAVSETRDSEAKNGGWCVYPTKENLPRNSGVARCDPVNHRVSFARIPEHHGDCTEPRVPVRRGASHHISGLKALRCSKTVSRNVLSFSELRGRNRVPTLNMLSSLFDAKPLWFTTRRATHRTSWLRFETAASRR